MPRVKKEEAGRTRARFIETTIELLQEKGYHAVGLNEIIQVSGSPRGSLYHHFPGGKDELVLSALEEAGRRIEEELRAGLATVSTPEEAAAMVFAFFEKTLVESDFRKGCPIATTAQEVQAVKPEIRAACSSIYRAWEETAAEYLGNREIARSLLVLMEGALLLAKVHREPAYLHAARDNILALL